MDHRITLSNGRRLLLEEGTNCLSLCFEEKPDDDPWWILTIGRDGILVAPNSGTAPEELVAGLSPTPEE